MRIDILPSATQHHITDTEIRTVISYPELCISLTPRLDNARPVLFIGRAADNQPHIEVIADVIDIAEIVVFHAMMLRPTLVTELHLDLFIEPEYTQQRA